MNDNVKAIIKAENVNKHFKLPHELNNSIKGLILGLLRGKKSFENQHVLKDISFEVKEGEFFGIVGRNGSGKSTLLKILAGIYEPTSGRMHVGGKLTPFIELGVGFNPELTGRENVFLNGALLGFSRKEMLNMYDKIVSFAELERFMDQKLKNYSSGMQVRLAFSIAIRAESDILLIDEVLAVGDQSFQEKCYQYFEKLRHSGKTVILVTHDMETVRRFCDSVLMLDKSMVKNGVMSVSDAVLEYNRVNHLIENTGTKRKVSDKNDIFIEDVRLLNKQNKTSSSFLQGESLTVEIKIGRKSPSSDDEPIVLGLAFRDLDNNNLSGPNSSSESLVVKDRIVHYQIPKLPFNMGEYKLTVALMNKELTKQYDLSENDVSFFVNTAEVKHGKFILEGIWRNEG